MAFAENLTAVDKEGNDKLRHEINKAWKTEDSSHSRQ
jgi:hypothetical protein